MIGYYNFDNFANFVMESGATAAGRETQNAFIGAYEKLFRPIDSDIQFELNFSHRRRLERNRRHGKR